MNQRIQCTVLVAFIMVSVAAGTGVSADAANGSEPQDASRQAEVYVSEASGSDHEFVMNVTWVVVYDASSTEEVNEAQNGTLDPSWYDGETALRAIASEYPGSEVEYYDPVVRYTPSSEEHGTISITTGLTIRGLFADSQKTVVIGPTIGEHLSTGDRIRLIPRNGVEPDSVNTDKQNLRGIETYVWEIGNGESPRFVLESGSNSQSDGTLSQSIISTLVAIAIVGATLVGKSVK